MKRTYLDYAATTPVDDRVRKAMKPYEQDVFGNPSSLHSFGQAASRAVYNARRVIAEYIHTRPDEIVFTSSATEANNLALRGIVQGFRVQGLGSRARKDTLHPSGYTLNPRIVVSAIEHESILETARDLESHGVEVVYLPVSRTGLIDIQTLKRSLTSRTILVSVMYANNEVGAIEPIAKIAKIVQEFRVQGIGYSDQKKNTLNPNGYTRYPLFHTDASQALQFLDCDVSILGVDFMTISSHKVYGPKGVGALYVRGNRVQGIGYSDQKKNTLNPSGYTLSPLITGGGQEHGIRSGTENISGIVGFSEAVRILGEVRNTECVRIAKLREYLSKGIKKIYRQAEKNTPAFALPNNLNVYLPGKSAHEMLVALDLRGVAVSAGSACAARSSEPSHVLRAMGFSRGRQRESLRFSLGRPTTKKEIDTALRAIKIVISKNL